MQTRCAGAVELCGGSSRARGGAELLRRIWVDGAKFNGTGHFAFSIADTNGVISWASGDLPFEGSTNLPPNVRTLAVDDGAYRVRLGGKTDGMPELKMEALRGTASPRLHVWFNDGVRGWRRVDEVALPPALTAGNDPTRALQPPEDGK